MCPGSMCSCHADWLQVYPGHDDDAIAGIRLGPNLTKVDPLDCKPECLCVCVQLPCACSVSICPVCFNVHCELVALMCNKLVWTMYCLTNMCTDVSDEHLVNCSV